MRVVVVSGIWPPDVGGPASHAPALARFLVGQGHAVEVVTTAERQPAAEAFPVHWASRGLPPGARHAVAAAHVASAARRADVVYATSMVRRAVAASVVSRRPVVVKLVADEAYERARRSGRFDGTLEDFQAWSGDRRVAMLRRTRTGALRRATHVFVPSAYLRDIALGWGLDPQRISVLPNPAPPAPELPPRAELRAALGEPSGTLLAFAGRLTRQKALGDLLAAVVGLDAVTVLLLGDGPERAALEAEVERLDLGDRVRFLGGGSRDDVLRLFAAADAAVLPSAWENFPHTVVEALAVGTPVVATAVGGVPEVVVHDDNGLLVPPHDVVALRAAIERLVTDPDLLARLAARAALSVEPFSEDVLLARIEEQLLEVALR